MSLSESVGYDLERWYRSNGRHQIPWRRDHSRWEVLVAEVMCCQTQVGRVVAHLEEFLHRFPDPAATAAAGQAAVVAAWGRLGYPRRARDLYAAARIISVSGWPTDLTELPGVGPWVAAATTAQADDLDTFAFDVNIRRVAQRVLGSTASDQELSEHFIPLLAPLRGRDRLLAALDLGATCCRRKDPDCESCPFARICASLGPLPEEDTPRRQAPYKNSLRQQRGTLLESLRRGPMSLDMAHPEALASLLADGLAVVSGESVHLA